MRVRAPTASRTESEKVRVRVRVRPSKSPTASRSERVRGISIYSCAKSKFKRIQCDQYNKFEYWVWACLHDSSSLKISSEEFLFLRTSKNSNVVYDNLCHGNVAVSTTSRALLAFVLQYPKCNASFSHSNEYYACLAFEATLVLCISNRNEGVAVPATILVT